MNIKELSIAFKRIKSLRELAERYRADADERCAIAENKYQDIIQLRRTVSRQLQSTHDLREGVGGAEAIESNDSVSQASWQLAGSSSSQAAEGQQPSLRLSRDMNTQSQVTYLWKRVTPRFQPLSRYAHGAWSEWVPFD